MKVLVFDIDGAPGVDIALRAQWAGHTVRYWAPAKEKYVAKGMLDRIEDWKPAMDWAELVIVTGNSKYGQQLQPFFEKGYSIFGANEESAQLELDRALGQEVLESHGVKVAEYHTVEDIDEAIELICDTKEAYAIKPWGGEADKSMTCVARDANEAIFMLELWKQKGLKGKLMLQQKIEGVEIGIAGWFGPAGWSRWVEESFEHKKFMNDDYGCNTGEMGTVIRHVEDSKLFDIVLAPITDYLKRLKYVGDCAVNCIVDEGGTPWPLEFTMRLGWPDFCIRQAVLPGDPVEWMADLLHGKDSFSPTDQVATGVLLAHGDFPTSHDPEGTWCGYPIAGISESTYRNLHFWQVAEGHSPKLQGDGVRRTKGPVSAGGYLMVASGAGNSVVESSEAAYKIAKKIKLPSNLMMRTDIGKRLEKDLPALQKHGFAIGMRYE